MYNKKFVKIYGLPRSGTNYLERILNENFSNINVLKNGNILGWKHGKVSSHYPVDWTGSNWNTIRESHNVIDYYLKEIEPYKKELKDAVDSKTVYYFFIVKHPEKWYDSYHRYSVEGGLKIPTPDVAAAHYNTYNIDYYNFYSLKPSHREVIRHEDFKDNGYVNMLSYFSEKFGFEPSGEFKNIEKRIDPSNVLTDNKYKPNKKSITDNDYIEMRKYLSSELLKRIGYE